MQSSDMVTKNLDLLLLAEALHMPELATAAGSSLANGYIVEDGGSPFQREPIKFSEHPRIMEVSRESFIYMLESRMPPTD